MQTRKEYIRAYGKERYEKCVRIGVCYMCKGEVVPGRKLCVKHIKSLVLKRKREYAAKRSAGLCGRCGKEEAKEFTNCDKCRKYMAGAQSKHRKKKAIERKCTTNGREPSPGSTQEREQP